MRRRSPWRLLLSPADDLGNGLSWSAGLRDPARRLGLRSSTPTQLRRPAIWTSSTPASPRLPKVERSNMHLARFKLKLNRR